MSKSVFNTGFIRRMLFCISNKIFTWLFGGAPSVECQWICVGVGSSAVTLDKFRGGGKCSIDNRVFNVSTSYAEHFFLPCMAIRYLYLVLLLGA